MTLFQAKSDLDIAAREMNKMAGATDIKTFYESWQNHLFRINRAWEFAERVLRKQKGYQMWFKPCKDQKEAEPLLIYLKAARNSETHAVSPTID